MQNKPHTDFFEFANADIAVTIQGDHPDGLYHDGDVLMVQSNAVIKAGALVALNLVDDGCIIFRAFDVDGQRVYAPETAVCFAPILADDPSCNLLGKVIGIQFA